MKKFTKITGIIAILIAAIAGIAATEHSSGIAGRTGSPGETTCNTAGCHSDFNLNSLGSISITSSNMTNWEYTSGTTYHMTVTITDAGANSNNLFGFDLEALSVADTISVGSLIVTTDTTKLLNATINGKVRINITHNGNNPADPGPTSFSFNFDWKAPATDSGYVKFYVAGIAADGDGTPSGDYVYATSQLIGGPSDVGVHNLAGSPSFSTYPNPVNSYCNIRFGTDVKGGLYDVQLYDVTGSLVQSANSLKALSGEITDFKIANDIASGIYLMRVISDGNAFTQKIIVNKN